MEVLSPEIIPEIEGYLDPFSDLYFTDDNFTDSFVGDDELCNIAKPVYEEAQITTLVFSIFGIILNLIVIFVMLVLKEHKKSRIYWFFLQIMASNVIFLICISIQMGNELSRYWATGNISCQVNEASLFSSHSAGISFLLIANLCGILSQFKLLFTGFPSFQCLKNEKLKSVFLILLVWMPCCLINLPLYKFSNINHCGHCILEFPLDMELCSDMLGVNASSCIEFLKMFNGDLDGTLVIDDNSTTDSEKFYLYGDLSGSGREEYDVTEIFSFLEMSACRYEEPASFYIWLYASFGLFYVTPLPIFIFFVGFYIYDRAVRKTPDKNANKDSPILIIIMLDISFFILCTPWNVVKMRKANGGIGPGDGKSCASAVNYARLSTVFYYILIPCIYGYVTTRFFNRLMTSMATTIHFFYRLFGWFTKKNTIVTSEKAEMKHSSSECDLEGDSDVTNDTEIEVKGQDKARPHTKM